MSINHATITSQVLQSSKRSSSARSTASESLSDWSGVPMKKINKMKSKDYSSSTRSSRRLYDVGKLEVQGKFPRDGYL